MHPVHVGRFSATIRHLAPINLPSEMPTRTTWKRSEWPRPASVESAKCATCAPAKACGESKHRNLRHAAPAFGAAKSNSAPKFATMSNIHSLEPQACGLIRLKTTFGELEVELFTKQCPKATRNFVQLCLDGYYDGTIFDRVEKDFIAIGGIKDNEKDAVQVETFPDEFHSRLKFSRRGLLATANTKKDNNGPSFFFTLGPTQELQNKHTIFGRLIGNSIYHIVDLNECQVDEDLRPLSETRILETLVVENPFPELTKRTADDSNKLEVENDDEDECYDPLAKPKREISKKLSFYQESDDDDDDDEDDGQPSKQHKTSANGDVKVLKDNEATTRKQLHENDQKSREDVEGNDETERERDEDEELNEKKLIEIRAQIQELKRQFDSEEKSKPIAERRAQSDLRRQSGEEDAGSEKSTYRSHPGARIATKKGPQRERETMDLVEKFRKKLKEKALSDSRESPRQQPDPMGHEVHVESAVDLLDPDELDILDGIGGDDWMEHRFEASEGPRVAKDANTKGNSWYSPDDPRGVMRKRIESSDGSCNSNHRSHDHHEDKNRDRSSSHHRHHYHRSRHH